MTPEAFFAAQAKRPFVMGITDCTKTANSWCMAKTGRSPIKSSGQDYSDHDDAIDLMATAAMPIRVARAMRAAGFKRTVEPKQGDLGILRLPDRYACAIRGEHLWLFRDECGMAGVGDRVKIVAAWTVE